MLQQVVFVIYKSIRRNIIFTLHTNNLQYLQCKRKKLYKFISNEKNRKKEDPYTISVINLSKEDFDTKLLKCGLTTNVSSDKEFFATAKTHKIISKYLSLLAKNDYMMRYN